MVKTIKSRKLREDDGVVNVGDIKLDAGSAEVIYADKEKDIQVVVSDDPEDPTVGIVAVLSNSNDDVEDEEVLGSATVEGEDKKGDGAEEAKKKARREAFRKRLEARRSNGTASERREAFKKRLEARRAARKQESRQKDIAEARAKFKSKLGKKA